MASENWKDVLKSQHDDLARLEEMDAALNENQISADIDKILKRPANAPIRYEREPAYTPAPPLPAHHSSPPRPARNEEHEDYSTEGPPLPDKPELAPETADRMMRAKYTFMSKQLTAALELRKKMEEQTRDLQRQLKTEREDKKSTHKRVTILESELRKTSRGERGPNDGQAESLGQEVSQLKKDLETAQRLVKQAETTSKTKDSQIKRAAESIARLKGQLQETSSTLTNENGADRSRAITAETRVRVLEKQRDDLMEGFRKQLKLIDILKRQKVHIEAARLLAFTEEEFMKTLDWKV